MLQWTNASHAHSHVPALGSAWQHKVSDRHTHQKPETNRRRAHRQSRKASGQSQLTRTTQVSCNLPFLLLTNTSLKKKDQWNLHRKPGGGGQRRGTRSLRQPEPAGEPSPCPWRRTLLPRTDRESSSGLDKYPASSTAGGHSPSSPSNARAWLTRTVEMLTCAPCSI